jgi:hypothetical protein
MVGKFFGMQKFELADDLSVLGVSRLVLDQSPVQVVGYADVSLVFALKDVNYYHLRALKKIHIKAE